MNQREPVEPTTQLAGTLDIDHARGVIYFHRDPDSNVAHYGNMVTVLRIQALPPMPRGTFLDVRAEGALCSWDESDEDE
jgi:hypothetical protein